MLLSAFIADQRRKAPKPNADIRSRWIERMQGRGLDRQGRDGATAYLRDYGKGISAAKVVALAAQAEVEGCDAVAQGFWLKAHQLLLGETAQDDLAGEAGSTPTPTPSSVPAGSATPVAATLTTPNPAFAVFPAHLQPGRCRTMQPVDGGRRREDYIADPDYLGQPKRDGSRLLIFASAGQVVYQARSLNLTGSPGAGFDRAFQVVAGKIGDFVLDGELTYLDVHGGEHRTGAQAATANDQAGDPQGRVRTCIAVFKALFAHGRDLTRSDEVERIAASEGLVGLVAQAMLTADGLTDLLIERVPTAWTPEEKADLSQRQLAEGREGEVWVRRSTKYLGGKVGGEAIVRTKYLEETEVVVTGLTPTTVAGRPFGAIEVADDAGRHLGHVGTGFDAAAARDLAARVAAQPGGVRIQVRHQGRTEGGLLWHARYLGLAG